jgi:cytoskeletal protein CcmA (bactofilin family)
MNGGSVIGRTSVVRGNIRGNGNLEIQGRVEGEVTITGDLVLSESAGVRGNLSGATIVVAGQVQGDVRGTESVMIEAGAKVIGDLLAPRIGVAAGALVKGMVRTDGEAPLSVPKRPAVAALRTPSFGAPKPVAAVPSRPEPVRAAPPPPPPPPPVEEPEPESRPAPPKEAAKPERQAPPPVVPALAKGAKAKKKKQKG